MDRIFMIELDNKLHGYHTRLKELHFSAPSYSMHKIIDEFDGSLCSFEDEIMENMQALFEFIQPGDLNPVLPEAKEIEELLEDLRGMIIGVKKEADSELMYSGIVNIVDDFLSEIGKYIYLVKIAKH